MICTPSSTPPSTAANDERQHLLSPSPSPTGGEHFEIDRSTSYHQQQKENPAQLEIKSSEKEEVESTVDSGNNIIQNTRNNDSEISNKLKDINNTRSFEEDGKTNLNPKGASIFQTALNIAKLCMGTGTLALPFASQKGGLVFNAVGLGLIGLWNYFSACCLLGCLERLPAVMRTNDSCETSGEICKRVGACAKIDDVNEAKNDSYGALDRNDDNNLEIEQFHPNEQYVPTPKAKNHPIIRPPPEGTTAYGMVAWYASGPKGLFRRVFPSRDCFLFLLLQLCEVFDCFGF